MPLFRLNTSFTFNNGDFDRFKNKAISDIAAVLKTDKEFVTVDIKQNISKRKREHRDKGSSTCEIIYFFEEFLVKAKSILKELLVDIFGEHTFYTKFTSHVGQILINWSERNPVVSSIPVDDQGPRRNCWAYIAAFVATCAFSQKNPSVEDLTKIRSSPQDLSDWVYSYHQLKKDVDKYGYYGCDGEFAFKYLKGCGVSLLENYAIEEFSERAIQTTFDVGVFKQMWQDKGDRIFIKDFVVTTPNEVLYEPGSNLHGSPVFSIEYATKILNEGIAYCAMFYCGGCEICSGLGNFNGEGVYDEPSHPVGHEYKQHAAAALGIGNLNGKDYIKIRNTRGASWAKNGEAYIHIKFFKKFIQVSGPSIKKLGAKFKTQVVSNVSDARAGTSGSS